MICQLEDLPVYYETRGEGRALLTIHGFYPDHRLMKGCMEPIFERRTGWRRIYFDLPGMGRTPGVPRIENTDKMLDLVLAFIDRIAPGERVVVAGESYGGYLARGLVYRRPALLDGLLLICPGIVMPREQRDRPGHVTLAHDPALMARLEPDERAEFEPMAVVQSERSWTRFREEILPAVRSADTAFLEALRVNGWGFSFDVDALPAPFDRPALFVMGRQDSSVGYRDAWRILEAYPRATFAVLDKAGHNLQIEQEGLFTALVEEWLERVEAE